MLKDARQAAEVMAQLQGVVGAMLAAVKLEVDARRVSAKEERDAYFTFLTKLAEKPECFAAYVNAEAEKAKVGITTTAAETKGDQDLRAKGLEMADSFLNGTLKEMFLGTVGKFDFQKVFDQKAELEKLVGEKRAEAYLLQEQNRARELTLKEAKERREQEAAAARAAKPPERPQA
jgi:hypothetical protein